MKISEELDVAVLQFDLVWEHPEENRKKFEQSIITLATQSVDIIVLPEMFTTGFTMNTQLAEKMNGTTVIWMQRLAKKVDAAIVGSVMITENERYYNRLLFVHPTGKIDFYDKRHLFTLAGENKVFTAGTEKRLVTYKGWKICLLICYDLRFPVWTRNTENYDVLLYVANWPTARIKAWDTLLQARAIENMCYTIGVNRVGIDANNLTYSGNSVFLDALGTEISKLTDGKEIQVSITLYKNYQERLRKKFRFLDDREVFTIS